jgi:hypothetical protein
MPQINPRYKKPTGNPDHARRRHVPAPSDQAIEARLDDLVKPALFAELDYYRKLGLRSRLLTLPVMVSAVLAMIWRRVPGVSTLQRMLARERLLWTEPLDVSQPSLSQRFLCFPAELFERVLYGVIAQLPERAAARRRPQALKEIAARFEGLSGVDGTTLEALFRKLGSLQQAPLAPLAGHLVVAVDLLSHLPEKLLWRNDPQANDKALLPELLDWVRPGRLLVFDLGYFAFPFFDALSARGAYFVTRLRKGTSFSVEEVLLERPHARDRIVHLGNYRSNPSVHRVRLIELCIDGVWRQYLTNVLDPGRLSVPDVVVLYEARWKVETTFLLVKRLLGLSYLWVGGLNGVRLQVFATFLFYAVLIDLCDEVAEELALDLDRISVEMVYRSLYFYVQARSQGYAGSAARYLAEEAQGLGIVKRKRKRAGPSARVQAKRALVE